MSLERKENGGTQHVTLYQDEVDYIVNATLAKNLHHKLVSFSFHQCIIPPFLNIRVLIFFSHHRQMLLLQFKVNHFILDLSTLLSLLECASFV
jgi:hypothetical protein